jgi:hypothetical protein
VAGCPCAPATNQQRSIRTVPKPLHKSALGRERARWHIGPNSLNMEQLLARETGKILAYIENRRIDLVERLKARESKPWQLVVALLPSVLTAILGVAVTAFWLKTNQRIDTSSKQPQGSGGSGYSGWSERRR